MKNWIILLIISHTCLLTAASAFAQSKNQNTLLWEVSGKGVDGPSYLFGTIHIMCPNEITLSPAVKQKFLTTKKLFLEVDIDDPGMMGKMMAGMIMKDTATLESLTGSNYDTLATMFKKTTGLPLQMFSKTKPFMVMSMLYPSILGCAPESFEGIFSKLAKDKNMDILGLETLEDQLDVFEKIPYKVQANMLSNILLNLDSARHEFAKMLQVYKSKNIEDLHKITLEDENFGEYEAILLKDRNKNWAPVIARQMALQPTFFAFGAGHLGGNDGIINLLRQKGYTVSPVLYN